MKNAPKGAQKAKKAKSRNRANSGATRRELSTFTFSMSENGLLSFTKSVALIRASKSLASVLALIDMRLEDFGAALGKTAQFCKSRPEGFSKGYISQISANHRTISPRMVKAIEAVLQQEISDLLGRPIGIKVSHNSPWHFRLAAICEKHGPYELIGSRKHCPVCGK